MTRTATDSCPIAMKIEVEGYEEMMLAPTYDNVRFSRGPETLRRTFEPKVR